MNMEVHELSFSYGKHKVLDNVSFKLREGELLAVLGPNGVGKSTLFYCMLGIMGGYSGQIRIEGEDIRKMSAQELSKKLAYVPQSHYPSFNYSVFDMVLMGTTAHVNSISSPGKREIEKAEAALHKLDISHLKDRAYTQISGGERQLTLIARAIAQQSRLIIMDEPTANLDYGNGLRVLMRIKELVREGYTVIQSTHNPDHAFLFADRVLALKDGRAHVCGPPDEVITSELIKALYGVEVCIQAGPNAALTCIPVIQYTA